MEDERADLFEQGWAEGRHGLLLVGVMSITL